MSHAARNQEDGRDSARSHVSTKADGCQLGPYEHDDDPVTTSGARLKLPIRLPIQEELETEESETWNSFLGVS